MPDCGCNSLADGKFDIEQFTTNYKWPIFAILIAIILIKD